VPRETTSRKMSLRAQLTLIVVAIVLAGFALTITILTRQAAGYQMNSAMQHAAELATRQGTEATAILRQGLETARTLAGALQALSHSGQFSRAAADAMLRETLQQNPGYVGVWSAWEPDAFDGRDADYAATPRSDASGRYLAQFNWDARRTTITQGVLADYDKPGAGDYYQIPKKTLKNALLEPYTYDFEGNSVLLTTISVPIVDQGRFVGAAGVDISLESLQDTIQGIHLYDHGYASLLSGQGMYVGDRDPALVGQTLSGQSGLDAGQLEAALRTIAAGEKQTYTLDDPATHAESTVIQVPIVIPGIQTPWAFAVTLPNAEVLHDIRTLEWTAAGLGLLSIILTSLVLAWALSRLVLRPLGGEPADAAALAARVAQGDLSQAIHLRPRDDFSLMYRLHGMQESLTQIIGRVREGADSVAQASSQISAGNLDLSSRTEQQSSSLAETAASMEEITATVRHSADSAEQASKLAEASTRAAGAGGEIVGQLTRTMAEINEKSQQIAEITGVIDSIAFQTNILALNAAVEAARAGEQGRGFAVVASEVRALAQRSATSAQEIRDLIQSSIGVMTTGNEQAAQASISMQGIVADISQVTDIIGEISAASREQTAGIEQINVAITQMDDVTRQNASLVEESATAAASLKEQADGLSKLVATFRLQAGSATAKG